jgi:hypothetical protein
MLVVAVGGSVGVHAYGPYVIDEGPDLRRVDIATGAIEVIGSLGLPPSIFKEGLVFHRDGFLYSAGLATPASLIRIDPATGAGTVVGPLGIPAAEPVDLAVDAAGVMWLLQDADLYVVDPSTGAATLACSQQDPDVILQGLAVYAGQKYVLQRWPVETVPLDCDLVSLGPDFGEAAGGYWLDGGSGDEVYGLREYCGPWGCTDRKSFLYRRDPGTGEFALVWQLEDEELYGLAFPPHRQPAQAAVPALGPWSAVVYCGLLAAAGVLALRLRAGLTAP